MEIEIIQKQDKKLLTEHAKSSYSFSWIAKNEWMLAILFLLIGLSFYFISDNLRAASYIFIAIGIIEIIKYPKRVERWVKNKTKEKLFNQNIKFKINDDFIAVSCEGINKKVEFKEMRKCLVSNSGIVFKISFTDYYYISFNSVKEVTPKHEFIEFLKTRFDKNKIKIKLD